MWAQTSWKHSCALEKNGLFFECCVHVCCVHVCKSSSKKAGTERVAFSILYTTHWTKSEYMSFVFRRKSEKYPWLVTEWSRHSVWPEHETVIISFHKKMKRRALLYIYIYILSKNIHCNSAREENNNSTMTFWPDVWGGNFARENRSFSAIQRKDETHTQEIKSRLFLQEVRIQEKVRPVDSPSKKLVRKRWAQNQLSKTTSQAEKRGPQKLYYITTS